MPTLDSLIMGDKITLLAVGAPSTGKTVSLADWPRPIQLHDFDFRLRPLLQVVPAEIRKEIEYHSYGPTDFQKFYDNMNKLELRCPFKTVVVDSLTTASSAIVGYSMSMRKGEVAASKGRKEYKSKGVIQIPEIEDYGAEGQALTDLIDFGRIIPAHFILTAHMITLDCKNLQGETWIEYSVLTAGRKIAAKIPALFDEVWWFEKTRDMSGKESYTVHFRGKGEGGLLSKTALPLPQRLTWTDKPGIFLQVQALLKEKGAAIKS